MFLSMNWISDFVDLEGIDKLDLIHRFSLSTAEVENEIFFKGSDISGIVVAEIKSVEEKWTWMKSLSNTANGNISGQKKIMLETYIQATFFDRILDRATPRCGVGYRSRRWQSPRHDLDAQRRI